MGSCALQDTGVGQPTVHGPGVTGRRPAPQHAGAEPLWAGAEQVGPRSCQAVP